MEGQTYEERAWNAENEVLRLRAELAATTAERDRAMKACEQIGRNWDQEVTALRAQIDAMWNRQSPPVEGSPDPAEIARLRAEVAEANKSTAETYVENAAMSDCIIALRAEVEALRMLLTRIRHWDAMDVPASDGAYWRKEIDAALAGRE